MSFICPRCKQETLKYTMRSKPMTTMEQYDYIFNPFNYGESRKSYTRSCEDNMCGWREDISRETFILVADFYTKLNSAKKEIEKLNADLNQLKEDLANKKKWPSGLWNVVDLAFTRGWVMRSRCRPEESIEEMKKLHEDIRTAFYEEKFPEDK